MITAQARQRRLVALIGVVTVSLVTTVVLGFVPRRSVSAAATPSVSIPTPLSTSLQSDAGTWATVPMGHLGQPRNTFWQLFFRPTGTATWSNEVEATATATNGGLELAAAPGQPLVAAVRPTNLLHFSPLVYTADGGHSWSDGVVSKGLASSPSALSISSGGHALALVDGGLSAEVLASTRGLSTWKILTTARRLASTAPGDACGVRSLTAVASLDGAVVVGAGCSRAGVAGIFEEQGGSWEREPVALARPLHQGRVEVLSLQQTATGIAALLGVARQGETSLVAAWSTGGGGWSTSPVLAEASGSRLVSFGPDGAEGVFALTATSSGAEHLAVVAGAGQPWRQIAPPPRQTETVAFFPAAGPAIDARPVDALAAQGRTMTVWALTPSGTRWVKAQVVHVNIDYGSSS
jgi:hypothetical protein